jgi:hypothetical protein
MFCFSTINDGEYRVELRLCSLRAHLPRDQPLDSIVENMMELDAGYNWKADFNIC